MGDWRFNTHVVGGRRHGGLYPVGGEKSVTVRLGKVGGRRSTGDLRVTRQPGNTI